MNCSISGEVPEEPVASSKSGLVYEKRLIEHHVSESGKCPVTGESLTLNDLVPLKTGRIVKPRAPQSASIPGMLGMFQTEWDSLMLSNFASEQQLHTLRKELSHALYQNDAACRVIARLKRERDEARDLLLTQAETNTEVKAAEDEVINGPDNSKRSRIAGITESIISEITDCNAVLSGQRKKRQVSPTLAPVEEVKRYTQLGSYPLHKTSKPGILCMDVHRSRDLIATGGADANSVVFDRSSGEIVSTLSGHSKKVTSVKFNADGDLVLTGSADKTVRMWGRSDNGDYNCKHILSDHAAEVEAISVHPTNNYFLTASLDKSWCFYDISSGLCLNKTYDPESEVFSSAAFHPDGLILGTGTASMVKVWDVKTQEVVVRFKEERLSPVTSISFSENGYYLAAAARDGVRLYDLRRSGTSFRSLNPYDENTATQFVEFDHSGRYFAFGGADVRVYQTGSVKSEWKCVKTLPDLSGTGKITCAKFGADAKYLAVGSMDRNLRIYGLPEEASSEF